MRGVANRPWLERPQSAAALADAVRRGRCSPPRFRQLDCWRRWGYCLLRQAVPHALIDRLQRDLDEVWTTSRVNPGLWIDQVRAGRAQPGATHRELVALPRARRRLLRDGRPWRIHGFEQWSESALAVRDAPAVRQMVDMIFGHAGVPIGTIAFMYGSEQALHQDVAVTHVSPYRFLVGAWVACEDIHPDSGPLVFYPGSQADDLFGGFTAYPHVALRNCDAETTRAYAAYVREHALRYQRRSLVCDKGDVLLWHGLLLHGGAPVLDRSRTRRSFVSHFTIRGANRIDEAEGPFNW